MATTFTGLRVQDTYNAILKIGDNSNLSGTAKILSDGVGNSSSIYLSTTRFGIGITPAYQFHTSGNAKIGGNLIISGNLTVNGTLTYLNVQDLAVEDPLIKLAKDNTANTLDIGLFGKYVATGTKYKGFYNDASDDKFKLFIGTTVEPTTTVDTSASGYTVGTLVANLEGNVTGTVSSLSNHTTSNLAEGTNLYYTTARFDTRFTSKNTDNLSEGSSNLYFTTARARASFTTGTGVTITSGQIAIGQAVSTTSNVTFGNITGSAISGTTGTFTGNLTTNGTFTVNTNDTTFQILDAGTNALQIKVGAGDEIYFGSNNTYQIQCTTSGNVNTIGNWSYAGNITGTTATFTGLVTGIAPTSDLNFATKKYVDDNTITTPSLSSVLAVGNTSGSNNIIMSSTAKIGINIGTPSAKLDVREDANNVYTAYFYNSDTGANANGINVQTASTNANAYAFRVNSGSNTNALTVMGNANIGIGTSTPSFQLSIENHATTSSIATMEIDGKRTNGTDGAVGELIFSNNGDTFATVAGFRDGADDKGSLVFQTQDGSNGFETRLTINSAGTSTFTRNVIIGGTTGSSGNALTVNRGSDGAQVMRILNTGEVVVSNNYLYANGPSVSMYVQNTSVFRGTIINDTSNAPVKIDDDLYVTGNVGVGITPSTSFSGVEVLQLGKGMTIFGNTNDDRATMAANLILNTGTAFEYVMDGLAGRFSIEDGNMLWGTAGTGTAGQVATVDTKMTLLNNGALGIGTTSPSSKLHIGETTNTNAVLSLNPNYSALGANYMWNLVGTNSGSNYNFEIREASTPYFCIRNSAGGNAGFIGIGTDSPNAKLDIKGAGGSTGLSLQTTDASLNQTFYIQDGGRVGVRYYPLTVGLPSSTSAASNAAFQVKVNNDFTVLTSGFVGIGTDTPLALLSLTQANGANIRFTNSITGRYFTIGEGVGMNDRFSFRGNSYRSTDTLTVDFTNNRVGINTITPDALLDLESTTPALRITDTDNNKPYELRVDAETFSIKEVSNSRTLMSMTTGAVITLDSLGSNTVINTSGAMVVPNGKVGIGTTLPVRHLQLQTINGARNYGIGLNDKDGVERATIAVDVNTNNLITATTGNMQFFTGSTLGNIATLPTNERMVITSTGLVKIQKNTASTTEPLLKLSNAFGSTTDGVKMIFEVANTSGNGGEIAVVRDSGSYNPYMRFNVSSGVASAPTERMRIDSSGNVGMPTVNTFAKLTVSGNIYSSTGTAGVGFHIQDTTDSSGTYSITAETNSTQNGYLKFGSPSEHTQQFYFDNNVGIGTPSPQARLDIQDNDGTPLMTRTSSGLAMFHEISNNYAYLYLYQIAGGAKVVLSTNGNSYFVGGNLAVGATNPTSPTGVGTFLEIRGRNGIAGGTAGIVFKDYDNDAWDMWTSGGGLFVRYNNATEGWALLSNGNMGVGKTDPSYKLDVTGTIRATSDVIAFSDRRVKENIVTIDSALNKVSKLRGVTYTRKDIDDKSTKVGVIAQEVLKVLPEVVKKDDVGMYSVAYGNMAGVFIEAIKELKAEVDSLKQEIKELKK